MFNNRPNVLIEVENLQAFQDAVKSYLQQALPNTQIILPEIKVNDSGLRQHLTNKGE